MTNEGTRTEKGGKWEVAVCRKTTQRLPESDGYETLFNLPPLT